MTTYRCWACRTATDDEGDCRNPHCPTLRGGDRLRHLTREQLREIDRTINRAEPRNAAQPTA